MQHPDEGTIHAWLDGALQQEEGAALETHVASCAECQAAVAEARGLIAASSRIVSALDIVPAGVIPARAQPKRAWYAAPQFRAAAAILFVAGASMLIMRGRGTEPLAETAERVMSEAAQESAPATVQDGGMAETKVAAPPEETRQVQSRSRVAAKAPPPKNVADEATGRAADMRQVSTESDATAAPVAAPAPVAAATGIAATGAAPPAAKAAARQLRLNTSPTLDNVVVTGVATGSTAELADRLTVLGVDSTGGARTTRYRLTSGEELTLSETQPVSNAVVSAQAERRAESAREMAAQAAPPPARADSAAKTPMATITWTDPKTGRRYTLSGRISRERLEQVRKTIESTRR